MFHFMKTALLIPIVSLPLLLSACVVAPAPRRAVVVEDDVYYRTAPRRPAVVVAPRRPAVVVAPRRPAVVVAPRPAVGIRYYNDARGRYYFSNGRRIYVNAGVVY
jgi:hypothetical protein